MMYKFVNTLDDSGTWLKHFEKRIGTTAPWKTNASGAVVILQEAVKHTGVEDPKNLQTVSPIDQTTQQAEVGLSKDIRAASTTLRGTTKRKKVSGKAKSKAVKSTVKALKANAQDIFAKDAQSKRQKDSVNSNNLQ